MQNSLDNSALMRERLMLFNATINNKPKTLLPTSLEYVTQVLQDKSVILKD